MVDRLARIERGRRHEDRRGANVLPGGTSLDQTERNRRSEENLVSVWFGVSDGPLGIVEDEWPV